MITHCGYCRKVTDGIKIMKLKDFSVCNEFFFGNDQ